MRRLLCALPAGLFLAGALAAQIGGSGTIQGSVSDPSGAVVPGAGFQTLVQEHMVVDALTTEGLNFVLKIGAAAEQITIPDSPAMLNTQDARPGAAMRNDVYSGLPVAMGTGGIGAGPRIHK